MKKITIQLYGKHQDSGSVELAEVPGIGDILITATGNEYTVTRRLFNMTTGEIIIQAKYNQE